MSDPPSPTYGGMNLIKPPTQTSGAAFELAREARSDGAFDVDDWTIEIRKGLKLLVARGGTYDCYEDAYARGLIHAQKGLDLLSLKGVEDLSIVRFDELHVAWWMENAQLAVRLVSTTPLSIDVPPVTVVVQDASGKVKTSAPEPPLQWHESFRYFRLSQVTDDLFDAYRNAYLALESILSTIAPQQLSAQGRPTEREGDWFKRALGEAHGSVPLTTFVSPGTADPVQELFDELYVGMRSAMSHAKSGRRVLLPRDETERTAISVSLGRLVQLYLKLAEVVLAARRLGGGMFAVFFRRMTEPMFANVRTYASDDESPLDPSDTLINPKGGKLVELSHSAPTESAGFQTRRLFWATGGELATLPTITRVATTAADGTPLQAHVFEGPLDLAGVDRFEAMLGLFGANVRQPRTRYSY